MRHPAIAATTHSNLYAFPATAITEEAAAGRVCVVCNATFAPSDGPAQASVIAGTITGTDQQVRACIGSCSLALGIESNSEDCPSTGMPTAR
jgi:hypothetical protein